LPSTHINFTHHPHYIPQWKQKEKEFTEVVIRTKADLTAKTSELLTTERTLNTVRSQLEEVKEKCDRLETELLNARQEALNKTESNVSIEHEKLVLAETTKTLQQSRSVLERNLEEAKADLEGVRALYDECNEKLHTLQREKKQAEAQCQLAKDRARTLEGRIEGLKSDLVVAKERVAHEEKLRLAAEDSSNESHQLDSENTELKRELRSRELVISELRDIESRLSIDKSSLEAKIKALNEEHAELKLHVANGFQLRKEVMVEKETEIGRLREMHANSLREAIESRKNAEQESLFLESANKSMLSMGVLLFVLFLSLSLTTIHILFFIRHSLPLPLPLSPPLALFLTFSIVSFPHTELRSQLEEWSLRSTKEWRLLQELADVLDGLRIPDVDKIRNQQANTNRGGEYSMSHSGALIVTERPHVPQSDTEGKIPEESVSHLFSYVRGKMGNLKRCVFGASLFLFFLSHCISVLSLSLSAYPLSLSPRSCASLLT